MKNKILFLIIASVISSYIPVLAHEDHEETGDSHHDSLIHFIPIQVLGEQNQSDILSSVPTVTHLHGDKLFKKTQTSLGETLSQEAGVNSSQFGPNASRPVIRGLEGDRIRVLQNGIGVLDVSGTSQDHAVPVNPLSSESIEIVRGPITLLYGSSAVGGVVNIVNSRIHKAYYSGFSGAVDIKGQSVDDGLLTAGKLDYGVNNFMIHVDADSSKTSLLRAPKQKIQNSESEQYSGALGVTYFFKPQTFAGFSYSNYSNLYGVVADPDVDINMNQERVDFSGALKLNGFFKSIQLKSAQTFYKHEELEGGAVGTTFKNSGNETRLEFIQSDKGNWNGILGLQVNSSTMSALGDEAFLPTTESLQTAIFAFEEINFSRSKVNFGLRGELNHIQAQQGAVLAVDSEEKFFSKSAALGYIYDLSKELSLAINSSYNERAPTYQELYSNGAHVATGIFERGNKDLDTEKSYALELSLRKKLDPVVGTISLFGQKFSNFVSLTPTGTFDDTDESGTAGDSPDDLQIFDYLSQEALLYGIEFNLAVFLNQQWKLEFVGDYLRGRDTKRDQNLPRISPARVGGIISYTKNQFSGQLELRHVFKQTDVAPLETETEDYQLVNLGGSYTFTSNESRLSLYLQGNNIFNQEARNHVSLLKNQMQLAGRGAVVGLRGYF